MTWQAQQLQLIPFLPPQHVAPLHPRIVGTTESFVSNFFTVPRVRFMRNALTHAGKTGRRVVSAFIATPFAQDEAEQVRAQWRRVIDQFRPKIPKLAALMDEAEPDMLAYMTFPAQHPGQTPLTIRSNVSTARSSAAPRSLASSPMNPPSPGSSAPSSSSRAMYRPGSEPDT